MRRIQDANIGPGDTFISANPGTNTPGTIVRKDHKNDVQEELCRAIESTGQAVDTTLYASGTGNRDQIAQMAAHYGAGGASYFDEDATSAADAYVIKPVQIAIRDRQAPAALFERQQIIFSAGASNTGSSTVDVSLLLGQSLGTTVLDIKLNGGIVDPSAGDIVSGQDTLLIYRQQPSPHAELLPSQISNAEKTNLKPGRKNLAINGDFKQDCWQRGINFTSAGSIYTADRWVVFAVGGNTDVDRVGSTAFPTLGADIGFGLRIQPQVGSTDCPIETRLESQDVFHLTNDTVTVQLIVNSNEAIDLGLELRTPTVEDNWAASVVEASTTKSIGSGDTLITHTFTGISSEVRKGLSLTLRPIGYTPGTLQLSIANVQVEKGTFATEFEFRKVAEELALCHRYYVRYERTSGIDNSVFLGAGHCFTASTGRGVVTFPVGMRDIPAFLNSSANAMFAATTTGTTTTTTSISATNIGKLSTNIDFSTAALLVAGNGTEIGLSTNQWIAFDAEL